MKKLAELYQELAGALSEMIPQNWSKLYYLGEVEENKSSWSSVFYFEESETKQIVKSHDIPER